MNTNYEKPSMQFVSLRNEEAVANTCWGHHSSGTELFCDIDGVGFMSFQIEHGSCTLNLINVKYYENHDSEGVYVYDGSEHYEALETVLRNSGGESGNPYKGEGSIVIPEAPSEKWS